MLEVAYKVVTLEQSYDQIKVILIETLEPVETEQFAAQSSLSLIPSYPSDSGPQPISPPPPPLEAKLVAGDLDELVAVEPTFEIRMEPMPRTDTEKVMSDMIDALEKFAPGLKESFTLPRKPTGMYRPPKPQSHIELRLSEEQYEELGSPQFQSIIRLRMEAN